MSYSTRLPWKRHLFRFGEDFYVVFFHSLCKSYQPSGTLVGKRLPLLKESQCTVNPTLTSCRHRYSFVYSSKSCALNVPTLWTRNSSNGKQPPSLGSIENEDTPLSKSQANELILRLTAEERKALLNALQEYNSNQLKAEYEAEKIPAPTSRQLLNVAVFNAIPFVGFGFLDNFIMICAGDYIDETLGTLVTISTMAAAALGNTISDVMGIGSAWYVEMAAAKIGLKPPNLSPIQLDMKTARRAANLGRALGITVGCLLGMFPLLLFNSEEKKTKHVK